MPGNPAPKMGAQFRELTRGVALSGGQGMDSLLT